MLELDRAAEEHRLRGEGLVLEIDLHLAEEGAQRHVDGAIDHQPERAALVVLADEGEAPGKIRDPPCRAWR